MKRLARFDKAIPTGITPSMPYSKKSFWADGSGVVFREGSVQPQPGQFLIFDKLESAPIRGMLECDINGTRTLFFGTQTKLYLWEEGDPGASDATRTVGGDYTGLVDGSATARATVWSFAQWGNWVIATNGVDEPQIWKKGVSSDNFVDLTGLGSVMGTPPKAELIVTFRTFMIAMNFGTDTEDEINWCDSDNVEQWVLPPTGTEAGNLVARDLNSPIIAAIPFGQSIAFAGTDSLHTLAFIGAPNWFGQQKALSGIGCISKQSLLSVGRRLYGFGPRGFYQTDGIQFQYIDQPWIREYILGNINRTQWSKLLLSHNVAMEQIEVHWPSSSSLENDMVAAWNYRNNHWTIPNAVRTASSRTSVFHYSIVGGGLGDVYGQSDEGSPLTVVGADPLEMIEVVIRIVGGYGEMGYGRMGYGGINEALQSASSLVAKGAIKIVIHRADGYTIDLAQSLDTGAAWVESQDLDLGDPEIYKFVQKILLELEGRSGATHLNLVLKHRNSLEDALQTFATIALSGGTGPVNKRMPGAKYLRLRFDDTGVRVLWKLGLIELYGEAAGRRFV